MRIVIPDDYQRCVRELRCFSRLAGHDVAVFHDNVKTLDALADRFGAADALVLTRERTQITAALLDRLPGLRLISQTGKVAGHIDLDACTARGIAVAEGTGSGAATAELTWALMLASRRHLVAEVNRLRSGGWQGALGQELRGQRLGVWSYGRIGRQVAAYGRAFGMQVWVWGREGSVADARADGFEVAPSRDAFFAESDIISLHIRLNAETEGLIGAADLARMRPTALLVNTSRAELVAPGALAAALRAGRPGFAAVDAYEQEPVLDAGHPLLHLDNALCTPHIGFVERDNYEAYFGTAFDNINAFFAGSPQNIANPQVLAALRA
ncbi:D-2-hydroxyacid dehydrogenase family protein [Cupriavidus sp. 2TAF22]|uniref:D-2-hydroxyacid dehydrogenase family protein n=1 Tax=unclassified Cupriavidus TaxID=2640874 RepID=UPI003F906141